MLKAGNGKEFDSLAADGVYTQELCIFAMKITYYLCV